MSIATVLSQRPEPKRDGLGRYLIGGKPYTRVTTWASTLADRYNLERWQQRMVAVGLVARHDLYAAVAATPLDDSKKLGKLCDQAVEAAKGSAGANLGTALHAFTEQVDLGQDIKIPPPWDADVRAYTETMAAAGITIDTAHVERIVVNHTLGVAGTFDRILNVPELGHVIGDVKTGGFLNWGEISIQLALYAHAEEMYDPTTDTCFPMPFVSGDVAVVIHIPVGQAKCTLYTVDVAAGWEMAQVAGAVRRWRNRKDLADPYQAGSVAPITPLEQVTDEDRAMRDWLVRRVKQLPSDALGELAAAWPAGVLTFRQTTEHTASQLRSVEAVVRDVEARHAVTVPNFDGDPVPVELIEATIARLQALPADLLDSITADMSGKVPNLRSAQIRQEHVDLLEPLIVAAETERDRRTWTVTQALAKEVDVNDPAMVAAVLPAPVDRLTAADVEIVLHNCAQLRDKTFALVVNGHGAGFTLTEQQTARS